MFCKFCGAENADNSKFCAYCGSNNEAVETNPAPQPSKVIDNPTTILDNAPPYTPINPTAPAPAPSPAMQPVPPMQNNMPPQSAFNAPPVNPAPAPTGAPMGAPNQAPYANNFAQPVINGELDENTFFDTFASQRTKSNYKWTMIICFVTAAVSLVSLFALGNVFSIVDIIFFVVFGILLSKKKKWVLPLGVAIYGGIGTVISTVVSGTPSGIFALVLSILATISAKKVNDAYTNYKATGELPTEPIDK